MLEARGVTTWACAPDSCFVLHKCGESGESGCSSVIDDGNNKLWHILPSAENTQDARHVIYWFWKFISLFPNSDIVILHLGERRQEVIWNNLNKRFSFSRIMNGKHYIVVPIFLAFISKTNTLLFIYRVNQKCENAYIIFASLLKMGSLGWRPKITFVEPH